MIVIVFATASALFIVLALFMGLGAVRDASGPKRLFFAFVAFLSAVFALAFLAATRWLARGEIC